MSLDSRMETLYSNHTLPARQVNTASPTMMLAALAALSSTPFTSATAAISAHLDLIARLIGVHSAFVSQLTSDMMLVLDSYDDQGCAIPPDGVVPLEETFCQHVRATGEAVVIPDAAQDVRVADVATRYQFSIGAYLGVPLLLSDGTLFGTLCALDQQPCQFSQSDIDLMRIVANQIAAVIEREGLHRTLDQTTALAEQRLDTTRTALQRQTELLRVVAHDVRTPLTTITGYTSLLKSGLYGVFDDEQSEVLDRIDSAARFINRLANDLVDSAAADTQRLSLIIEAFDPQQLIDRVVGACMLEATSKGLALSQQSTALPATIAGDSDRLQQVLFNLLSNALRYTDHGSVTVHASSGPEMIEFRVEDTGPGIPVEQQQQIWQRYTRVSNHGPGLGLGLYVVRQLVSAMGGSVGLDSAPGAGCCFWVRLPLYGPRPQALSWD